MLEHKALGAVLQHFFRSIVIGRFKIPCVKLAFTGSRMPKELGGAQTTLTKALSLADGFLIEHCVKDRLCFKTRSSFRLGKREKKTSSKQVAEE